MKTPLHVSDSEIIRIVNSCFTRELTELTFIPEGEVSWLYRAKDQNGEQFVIKIQRKVQAASSEVLAQLAENKYRWVPESILTSDSMLWVEEGEYHYSVQRYIHSETLHHAASMPTTEFLHQLGAALAELYTLSFDKTKLSNVAIENFRPNILLRATEAIEILRSDASGGGAIEKVRQVFEKRNGEVEQLFNNLLIYGNILRNKPYSSLVVVHGDMHFGNILKPNDDHLYFIDWDHTQFALPEMDLMYLTDQQIATISETYGKDLLENRIAIQYYRNFLLIRAIDFFLNKLFDAKYFEDEYVATSVAEIFDMSPYMQRALTSID